MAAEAVEDRALLTGIARGDSDAVTHCLRAHGDLLWSLAGRFAPDDGAREEAVMEVFGAIWREVGRYRDSRCAESLILAMIGRRRLWAWRCARGDDRPLPDGSELAFDAADDDGRLAAQVLAARGDEAQRVAVLLLGYGLTTDAVATALGLDELSVRRHLRDALEAVRQALEGDEPVAEAAPVAARQRLLDLLADATVRRLDDAEAAELESGLAAEEVIDAEAMERAAAAVVLALGRPEGLPDSVRDRIIDRWRRWPGVTAPRSETERRGQATTSDGSTRIAAYWLAAGGLVLALVGWWPTLSEHLASPDSPRERLQSLLADDASALEAEWQPGGAVGDRSVSGRVVWSQARQEGYMILENVPVNDPDEAQYQLWIFDAERQQYPVNGGVFNVPADEPSVVVPIQPEIDVGKPELFAVTRERPGGVVVSERDEVVLKAKPKDSDDE